MVDDEPRLLESMKRRIGREISWEVDWETATDVDEGCRFIVSSVSPFDLVIADLMFPREDFPDHEPRGLRLVREASRRSSHTFIMAISIGPEHVHDLMDRARQLGAHHVVRRSKFSTESAIHSPAAIAADIQRHLLDNGTVREAERGEHAAEVFPPNLLIPHRPQHMVGPVNGWYALGGPFMERAITLRNWLRSDQPPATAVGDLMEDLFVDGLGGVYRDGQFEHSDPSDSFAFTPYRQQSILQVLDELTEAIARVDGGSLGEEATGKLVRDVKAFVTERCLPTGIPLRDVSYDTYFCYQHGDLHAGNVLVSTQCHGDKAGTVRDTGRLRLLRVISAGPVLGSLRDG
ncbi:MAG: response regulator transcription factor [Streptosporangiaceae bacterium]